MAALRQTLTKHWVWIIANLGGLYPLATLLWDFSQGDLGADPVSTITKRTGTAAILMLTLSLACTPVNSLFGFRQILTVRKSLGLYAFLYAALHLTNFVALDYGLSLKAIFDDALLKKPYMIVGFSAFLILLPLAITSTRGWMKRLGRNWKRLHQLVYAAGILAVLHYYWLVKIDITKPLLYAAAVGLLLVLRLPPVRHWISRLRPRPTSRASGVRAKGKPTALVSSGGD